MLKGFSKVNCCGRDEGFIDITLILNIFEELTYSFFRNYGLIH